MQKTRRPNIVFYLGLDSWHPKEKVDFENILIFKIISISSRKYLKKKILSIFGKTSPTHLCVTVILDVTEEHFSLSFAYTVDL